MSQLYQEATLGKLPADAVISGPRSTYEPSVDQQIYERIRKCFERGYHRKTPREEANTALRMGARLMTQYNITQADLAHHIDQEGKSLQGGASVVKITSPIQLYKKVIKHGFTIDLAAAMEVAFDCKHYSTAKLRSIDFTFYGIATNTIVAATSFVSCYNLILDRAKVRTVSRTKHSYMMGFAQGLLQGARKEKERELKGARQCESEALAARLKKERAQLRAEHQRILGRYGIPLSLCSQSKGRSHTAPSLSSWVSLTSAQQGSQVTCGSDEDILVDFSDSTDGNDEDSGSEDGVEADFNEGEEAHLNPFADFDDEMRRSRHPRTWASELQLTTFRAKAQEVADDWLKAHNIKLYKLRSRPASIKDRRAYKEGLRSGQLTDFKRKKLGS